ncbi:hypothetical protein EYR36_001465 [Pleurotus pulmonarius]|nr:hypothetical protein EYR36_001465 [Pleurotus pulmonarius]
MLTVTESLIISIFIMSFFQGIFTVLLGAAVYFVVIRRSGKRDKKINWLGLGVVVIMYMISTTHYVMVIYQDVTEFSGKVDPATRDVKAFARFGLAQIAIEFLNCIMADSLLVWRAWVIYNRDWRITALPAALVCGVIITFYGYIGSSYAGLNDLKGNDLQEVFSQAQMQPIRTWQVTGISFSTTTNIFLTSMMAIKLILHHRTMKRVHGFSTLIFESLVIIESGALYTFAWIAYLVLFALGNNAESIALDTISQMAGIVPALIIVTISAGLSPVSPPSGKRSTFAAARGAGTSTTDIAFTTHVSLNVAREPHKDSIISDPNHKDLEAVSPSS